METTHNVADKPFALLLSMGYSEMYIQRAIKVHKRSKFGTNWDLWVLVQIIDRLTAIDWKNEKEYHKNLLNPQRKHQHSKSLNLPQKNQTHHNSNTDMINVINDINSNSNTSSIHEALYMKALNLHQNKHYEECERVIKNVLRTNPNHPQALLLYKDLVEQRLSRFKPYASKNIKQKKNGMLSGIGNSIWNAKKRTFKKHKMSDHPCRIEFRIFLRKNIQLNEYYENLEHKFVSNKYDDIRILKDFDANMLETEIGLQPLHCKLFMKKVEIFIKQVTIFQKWVTEFVDNYNISIDLLSDFFENNGILTFDALYRHIECISDLNNMIQNNENIANLNSNFSDHLWHEIQLKKRINKNKHYRSKTMEINKDKKRSQAMHWGFTNGNECAINNDEKINDDEFIAALSPAAKSIEDMFLSLKSFEAPLPTSQSSNMKTLTLKTNGRMSITSFNNDSSDEKESEVTYI